MHHRSELEARTSPLPTTSQANWCQCAARRKLRHVKPEWTPLVPSIPTSIHSDPTQPRSTNSTRSKSLGDEETATPLQTVGRPESRDTSNMGVHIGADERSANTPNAPQITDLPCRGRPRRRVDHNVFELNPWGRLPNHPAASRYSVNRCSGSASCRWIRRVVPSGLVTST